MAIAASPVIVRPSGLPTALASRLLPQHVQPALDPAPGATLALGGSDPGGAPLARSAGFAIHQLLATMPELRSPPADLRQTIDACRAHLASRIHYSGPVGPVDLRV